MRVGARVRVGVTFSSSAVCCTSASSSTACTAAAEASAVAWAAADCERAALPSVSVHAASSAAWVTLGLGFGLVGGLVLGLGLGLESRAPPG